MRGSPSSRRPYLGLWVATWAIPAILQLSLAAVFPSSAIFGSELALFWIVLVAASLCAVTSTAVIARAVRRDETELGYLGLFFLAVSVLPLVHGITTPGVLYQQNAATMSSVFWSIPAALVLSAPLLAPVRIRNRFAHRVFNVWSRVGVGLLFAMAAMFLRWPNLVPVPTPRSGFTIAVVVLSFAGCVRLAARQLHLSAVARSVAPLSIAVGYGFVGASALVWIGSAPFSAGFWVAHLLDISGVFAGTIGALVVFRRSDSVRALVEPVLVGDPLAALEFGLDPIVHRFVADLEAKDPITRDHVVRTAELAVEIASFMGFNGVDIRNVGLAGLLHDVGKLEIPDAILNKPGSLSDDEYETMKRHVIHGERLVLGSPALSAIAPAVRSHHERIDGRGYPDRLAADAIPLFARIISVCDAFDAMANTRQYRDGMGVERAMQILDENAGSQWDADVVRVALHVIEHRAPSSDPKGLAMVGRIEGLPGPSNRVGCDCFPREAENLLADAA